MNKNGCLNVLGVDHDQNADATVRAAIVMPVPHQPLVYADSRANVDKAIEERIDKKKLEFTATGADRAKIGAVVRAALYGHAEQAIFRADRVQAWGEKHLSDLEGLKSKKWGTKRFWAGIENLYKDLGHTFLHKASVKAEPMPAGKAPRMLIADGDDGTLMAIIAIKCFEDLLFEHMEQRSIKHAPKKEAMQRVVKNFTVNNGTIVEGDGSAWDTCCSSELREIIENPIVEHITGILARYCIVPESWLKAHMDSMKAAKLKIFLKKGLGADGRTRVIDSIRRSGHRGTSCLNYWVNHTLWYCCLYQTPEKFLNPKAKRATDMWGEQRTTVSAFEGDDSLLQTSPPVKKREKDIEAFWTRHGFHMKLVYAQTRATFTGWNFEVKDGELTGTRAPDLGRAMKNAGVTTSATAVQAAKDADVKTLKKLAGSIALSRAYDFAGIFPTVSSKYLQYADDVGVDYNDHELQMRVGEGVDLGTVRNEIAHLNLVSDGELEKMGRLGYKTSTSQLLAFEQHPWDFDNLTDYQGFSKSIPTSWVQ